MPTNGRTAYGQPAERYARCFAPTDPVIVFDHSGAADALRDAAARRFRNETFFVRAILQRDYAARIDSVVPTLLASFPSTDDRRIALEQAFAGTLTVNAQPLYAQNPYASATLRLMQAVIRLADGLIVSSESERRRIQDILVVDPPSITQPMSDPTVPLPKNLGRVGRRDAVVIWAPHLSGDICAAISLSLSELRCPVLLVSDSAANYEIAAQRFPVNESAEALSRAKLVVDASAYGCDAAVPLEQWGVPIVADVESGAQEVLGGVRVFDRRRFASIFDAVINAVGQPPSRCRKRYEPMPWTPVGSLLEHGPLVSIVLPTLDRPEMLRDALTSIRNQSYRNIETIVVIDGGPRLESLALDFPDVRFLAMPENNPLYSSNAAFAATSGKYVAFLNDDDVFFPQHIAALATALEQSGGAVAHADVLTAFLRSDADGWKLYGFESNMSRATDAASLLVSNQIGMTSCMFRKDCISDGIPFEKTVPLYRDYALWVRLAVEYDFVHVERLTSCYTIRNDGAQQQSNMWYDKALESYNVIYRQYPVESRPHLQRRRKSVLDSVASGQMQLKAEPAGQIQPVPWPIWG